MTKLYKMHLKNIEYWKRVKRESSEIVYVKDKIDSFTLLLDKLGNPRTMPYSAGTYYMDLITGRLISIREVEEYLIIKPSGIIVAKEVLSKDRNVNLNAARIVDQNYEQYSEVAEDIEYNTYFCNKIALREGMSEIPLELVKQEIEIFRKAGEEMANQENRFYQPEFSAYDFMCLFTVINVIQKTNAFDRDSLIKFISYCKNNNKFNQLLNDININSNGVFAYSNDLEEAIQKLRLSGLLYTISPESDAKIFIFENIQIANLIGKRIDYFDDMIKFIKNYKQFDLNNEHERKLTRK